MSEFYLTPQFNPKLKAGCNSVKLRDMFRILIPLFVPAFHLIISNYFYAIQFSRELFFLPTTPPIRTSTKTRKRLSPIATITPTVALRTTCLNTVWVSATFRVFWREILDKIRKIVRRIFLRSLNAWLMDEIMFPAAYRRTYQIFAKMSAEGNIL